MKNKGPVKRVRCNLLEAEVYVRFPVCIIDGKPIRQYCELQETPCKNGVVENYVQVDYPVTPESVNSYADSADYKKNPEVVTKAVSRQNLGDITEIQQVLRNDMTAMRDMLQRSQEVAKKLEEFNKANSAPAPVEEPKKEEVNNG